MSKNVRRLYEQFKPEYYELWLDPDRDTMRLRGRVTISGHKTGRPSQRLTFHQKDLKITKAEITRHDKKGDQTFTPTRINYHKRFDEVRLHAEHMLYPGRYTVTLEFEGLISRPMNGVYPCFFEHDGQKKSLIATQFESHHAREAFPCVDEPEAKATFALTVLSPKGETIVANTPIQKQETRNQKLETCFEATPKMSTYLLAFVYGEMKSLEARTKDGILVRTLATPDNTPHTQFALETAVKILTTTSFYSLRSRRVLRFESVLSEPSGHGCAKRIATG